MDSVKNEDGLRQAYLRVFENSHDDIAPAMEAMQRLKQMAESNKWGVWPQIIQARILRTEERYEEALELLKQPEEDDDTNPYILLLKGAILSDLGKRDAGKKREAIKYYTKIINNYERVKEIGLEAEEKDAERAAKAHLCKALDLINIGEYQQAREVSQHLLNEFELDNRSYRDLSDDEKLIYSYIMGGKRVNYRAALHFGEKPDLEFDIENDYFIGLHAYLEIVRAGFNQEKQMKFFDSMEKQRARTKEFLSATSDFKQDRSLLFILREWNSFTPAIPEEQELDRGGGYFILHNGEGIVIDPGYDFVKNFYDAGGHIHDITHIIITHAHDDHTAELEKLLMLFYQYNRERELEQKKGKEVKIYLSQGATRKFSGIIPLRDCDYINRVVTLSRPEPDAPQEIKLCKEVTLHVLPAYHDDVLTKDTAVGLELVFDFDSKKRRIVFTGDTGLFPIGPSPYNPKKQIAQQEFGKALYERYTELYERVTIDLLVAHIGSIKPEELEPLCMDEVTAKPHRRFYPNHLGLLGTLILLDQLRPNTAIISEFGEELKDIRYELVSRVSETLCNLPKETDDQNETFIIPGDLTMIYDIRQDKLFCHENCRFESISSLECHPALASGEKGNPERAFLFTKKPEGEITGSSRSKLVKTYQERLRERDLPYFFKEPVINTAEQ